jgi:hypothetical protein
MATQLISSLGKWLPAPCMAGVILVILSGCCGPKHVADWTWQTWKGVARHVELVDRKGGTLPGLVLVIEWRGQPLDSGDLNKLPILVDSNYFPIPPDQFRNRRIQLAGTAAIRRPKSPQSGVEMHVDGSSKSTPAVDPWVIVVRDSSITDLGPVTDQRPGKH